MTELISMMATEPALLVHIYDSLEKEEEGIQREFEELAKSAGALPITTIFTKPALSRPKYYIGKGKVMEIVEILKVHPVNLILFNRTLSPSQKRNLELVLQCRVVDRTELVLDIFAQRAKSFEGKLQVLLAQLQHLSTRLIRGWTHLERQKGGIGLRGPGETQLETDRRLIQQRIKIIQSKLEKVKEQRAQNRKRRYRHRILRVALVGYTNAGKSSIFRRLTQVDTWIANQLFATLDPVTRKVCLSQTEKMVLSDTVGFIRQLPHELVDAFSATLEEVRSAHLLLHVIDASDPNHFQLIKTVNDILKKIDAHSIPQILLYNKVDRLNTFQLNKSQMSHTNCVWLSANTGQGFEKLQSILKNKMNYHVV